MSNKTDLTTHLKKRALYAKIQAYLGLTLIIGISTFLISNIGQLQFDTDQDGSRKIQELLKAMQEVKGIMRSNNISRWDVKVPVDSSLMEPYSSMTISDWEIQYKYYNTNRRPDVCDSIHVTHELIAYKNPIDPGAIYESRLLMNSYSKFVTEYQDLLLNKFEPQFGAYIKQLEDSSTKTFTTINGISGLIIRVGIVLISLYLIQILLTFTRYQFRYSDFLASLAFALEYTDDDHIEFETLVSKSDSSKIDLGKSPRTVTQEVIDLLNSLKDFTGKTNP